MSGREVGRVELPVEGTSASADGWTDRRLGYEAYAGDGASSKSLGLTAPIYARPAADRQVPAGYDGNGVVAIQLPKGIRYFVDSAVGTETHEGRIAVDPDVACQIMTHTGAVLAT